MRQSREKCKTNQQMEARSPIRITTQGALFPSQMQGRELVFEKNQKIYKMGLTIRRVALLSPPACRKRECRKEKKQHVKRSIFKSTAIDLSENSSEKISSKMRFRSLEKQRLNCVLRVKCAQAGW